MAIIDVVKISGNDEDFVIKYPSENLRLGSQLVVNTAQTAFFVKGGKIFDQFESGTYTLKSENIPLLHTIVNLPFGGNSPFQAEVWFVNRIAKLDLKWGTPIPILIEDPKYKVIIPVRAFGQYGFRIGDPRLFFETLVGNMPLFTTEKINDYFRGKILSWLSTIISDQMISNGVSIFEMNAKLDVFSDYAREKLKDEFKRYGLDIISFFFMSINVSEEDPSVIKLKEAKDLAAKINIVGKDVYQMDRSFGVLDKAAENDSGISGTLASGGLGAGLGLGLAGQISQLSQQVNTSSPPPIPDNNQFHVVINNRQSGPYNLAQLTSLIQSGQITINSYVWKAGMANWMFAKDLPEISTLFFNTPPPPPPII